MSSAGHILDMIKRIRQNRSLRPSNRQKFKEDTRETIYSETHGENKASFKEFPKSQVKAAVEKIRREAKSERRRDLFLLGAVIIMVITIVLYIL